MSVRLVMLGCIAWMMPAVVLFWPCARAANQKATPSGKARIWQDERIGIVIDKVEVGESLSPKLAEDTNTHPYGPFPARARAGNKYVCIVFTLDHVKGVYVDSFGSGTKPGVGKSSLRDGSGRAYELTYWRAYQISVPDLHDITKAHLGVPGTNLMVFEVPIEATPRSLTLLYLYRNSLTEKDDKQGRLDITL